MKQLNKPVSYLSILFLTATITTIACSTTGMQRSEEFQSSLQTMDEFIEVITEQVDATGSSLAELTDLGQNQGSLEPAFEYYSENVSELEAMENEFNAQVENLIATGRSYLEGWDDDYNNPEIQRQSEERRAELSRAYERIEVNSQSATDAFRAYVSDISEIESFLSNDLTTEGINSIKSVADTSVRNGDNLKEELRDLHSAVEQTRAEMERSDEVNS